ncbi:MAG: hypothetical protein HXY25_09765, partial [Alphaproteobacteria bacterium]|nr:hypothetical protein [Alphaproteobacteria bacterium]
LDWLAARGALSAEEAEAGERLRRDFTLGNLSPRVTMDWDFLPAERSRRQPASAADLRRHRLAARERVEAALRVLGAGLGDLVLDVC